MNRFMLYSIHVMIRKDNDYSSPVPAAARGRLFTTSHILETISNKINLYYIY